MPCPFPGMDPYLERSAIWPDFHDSLIAYLREALQPYLRPRYVALTQDRLYVVEHDRPIRSDVSIIRTRDNRDFSHGSTTANTTEVMVADRPLVVDLSREEIHQPYLQIIEPAAGNRVVTAIEVLSPDNKMPGPGRVSYLAKQEELWAGHTNLVEIDLLRVGQSVVRIEHERLQKLEHRRYLVSVTRSFPTRCELYGVPMQQRLPHISLPLASDDNDILLNLQDVFTRCWNTGPYPELLNYNADPPGEMSGEELDYCRKAMAGTTPG